MPFCTAYGVEDSPLPSPFLTRRRNGSRRSLLLLRWFAVTAPSYQISRAECTVLALFPTALISLHAARLDPLTHWKLEIGKLVSSWYSTNWCLIWSFFWYRWNSWNICQPHKLWMALRGVPRFFVQICWDSRFAILAWSNSSVVSPWNHGIVAEPRDILMTHTASSKTGRQRKTTRFA